MIEDEAYRRRGLFGSPKKALTTVIVGVALVLVLSRLGVFDNWADQPPVNYLLSDPDYIVENRTRIASYAVHVPVGTPEATIRELLVKFIVPEILRSTSESETKRDRSSVRLPSPVEFRVYSTYKPGTEELKTAGIDQADSVYRWAPVDGLVRI